MKPVHSAVWLVLFFLLLTVPVAQAADIYLSAASSLKETVDRLTESFARKNPGVRFIKNYGGSGVLARQLESGAPVDVFLSANVPWVNYLEQKHLLMRSTVTDFTFNTVVLVGNPELRVSTMKDLLKLNRIAIGSPRSVPAGEYAIEALRNSFLLKKLEKKLVMAKDDRECMMYAETGAVDGAMVYRTDALLAKKSKVLFTVPQNLYERVVYPMGMTSTGIRKSEARAFFRFLQGPEAKTVLVRYGFPPGNSQLLRK
jgi:molybdate transport system substrate-binding protein